jgi:hypothetical protein
MKTLLHIILSVEALPANIGNKKTMSVNIMCVLIINKLIFKKHANHNKFTLVFDLKSIFQSVHKNY